MLVIPSIHPTQDDDPRIVVVIRNDSVRDVFHFHAPSVTLLGRIRPTSPSVTVQGEKVDADQVACLRLIRGRMMCVARPNTPNNRIV